MEEKRQLIYSAISSHHFSVIMEKLYYQFKDGRNCDLEIRVSDGRIFAHKCLVDIFFTQVGTELEEDRFVLDLADFNEDVITCLLDMMYTGELCIQPHLIKDLQDTASQLGYYEAEKGCKTYLSSYSNNGFENSSMPFRIVKEEPVDTGYQDSETTQTEKGTQEEFEKFASSYVQNLLRPVEAENQLREPDSLGIQLTEPDSLPCTSSVAASKNIYEIVQGQPSKDMKLPDVVVEKANEMSSHVMKSAVDTAPALQKDRDPFLVVSRDNGVVVLKKEKKIDPTLFKGNNMVNSATKAQGKSLGKIETGKRVKVIPASKIVNTVSKYSNRAKKTVDCSTGTTDGFSSDSDMSEEYSDDSMDAEVVIENVEQSVPKLTRSGRASKRAALFNKPEVVKRKRGRPRKPQMDPYEYEELKRMKLKRKTESYLKRKKVVIDKHEYESDKFKLVAAAGSVPEGCKSRYGRMELMKTKLITETVCKGDGSVSVTTKEIPRRMTWHERQADKQKRSEPVFVICHPTAPVVRP